MRLVIIVADGSQEEIEQELSGIIAKALSQLPRYKSTNRGAISCDKPLYSALLEKTTQSNATWIYKTLMRARYASGEWGERSTWDTTLGELTVRSADDLLGIRLIGTKLLQIIRETLHDHDLSLRGE